MRIEHAMPLCYQCTDDLHLVTELLDIWVEANATTRAESTMKNYTSRQNKLHKVLTQTLGYGENVAFPIQAHVPHIMVVQYLVARKGE